MNAIVPKRLSRRLDKHQLKKQTYDKAGTILTIEGLREHLQTAIEIEHATIPPYLCALYSIKEGTNQEAYHLIQSVVMEEMLHMLLACNILNAIGGSPAINQKDFVPSYPGFLPHSSDSFTVGLLKFSDAAIDTFLDIEQPAKPCALPEPNHWHTIGQFYEAIQYALCFLDFVTPGGIFTGDPSRQLGENDYYGGGGKLIKVNDLDDAMLAIKEIVGQGEGSQNTIFDTDSLFDEPVDIAHYFKFNEIKCGRCYTCTDTPESGPTGEPFKVDYSQAYNMHPNPKMSNYEKGSELYNKTYEFNKTYKLLLDAIHDAVNGSPDTLKKAIPLMYDIKYRAIALMKTPYKDGMTAGPSFEWVE